MTIVILKLQTSLTFMETVTIKQLLYYWHQQSNWFRGVSSNSFVPLHQSAQCGLFSEGLTQWQGRSVILHCSVTLLLPHQHCQLVKYPRLKRYDTEQIAFLGKSHTRYTPPFCRWTILWYDKCRQSMWLNERFLRHGFNDLKKAFQSINQSPELTMAPNSQSS